MSTQNNRNPKADEQRNDSSRKDGEQDDGSTAVENVALLSWQAPSHRNNGESLYPADIKEYRIRYGTTRELLDLAVTVPSDGTLDMEHRIEDLEAGEWFFTIQAVDYNENISNQAALVSKTL
ncbi:MAG: hypothetical protein R3296_01585 [Oleiphilaceae bacterium]|nr:hypothetical protein [Oleiphilaceae bacterium]